MGPVLSARLLLRRRPTASVDGAARRSCQPGARLPESRHRGHGAGFRAARGFSPRRAAAPPPRVEPRSTGGGDLAARVAWHQRPPPSERVLHGGGPGGPLARRPPHLAPRRHPWRVAALRGAGGRHCQERRARVIVWLCAALVPLPAARRGRGGGARRTEERLEPALAVLQRVRLPVRHAVGRRATRGDGRASRGEAARLPARRRLRACRRRRTARVGGAARRVHGDAAPAPRPLAPRQCRPRRLGERAHDAGPPWQLVGWPRAHGRTASAAVLASRRADQPAGSGVAGGAAAARDARRDGRGRRRQQRPSRSGRVAAPGVA